ncbi:hypothetical protein [Micromonospora sicca]
MATTTAGPRGNRQPTRAGGVVTVKTHITNLMTETSSPNRVRLALFARGA